MNPYLRKSKKAKKPIKMAEGGIVQSIKDYIGIGSGARGKQIDDIVDQASSGDTNAEWLRKKEEAKKKKDAAAAAD